MECPKLVLPTPGGPKTQNGTFGFGFELHHRQMFDDAVLDVLEAKVILIEDLLCPYQVQLVCGRGGQGSSRANSR